MSLFKPWTWFSSDEERTTDTYDGEQHGIRIEPQTPAISIEHLRDGIVLEGSTRDQNKKVIRAIREDLDHLDEAPVPVFDATPMIPSTREGPYKTWPRTRVFLPTHYGGVLWKHVYVFDARRLDSFEHKWKLVDDCASARIVLGEANHDIDVMEYLES